MYPFDSMEYEPESSLAQAYRLRSAGLVVLLSSDAEFAERQQSPWSLGAQLSPSCIVRPRDTQEVSIAIRSLVANSCSFAVRSGGHTPWAGASSMSGGIVLDLGLMAHTRLNEMHDAADIGPGARWNAVYAELAQYGRVVAGGREGNVGVGGLILGGGNTFLTAKTGFACDTLLECEIVLADGSIIVANAKQNSDLLWALKGGSNNFGVVTRFRMRTFPATECWGGLTIYPKQASSRAVQNLIEFTDNLHKMQDSNLLCFFAYTVPEHSMPPNYHNIFFTATLKNDSRIASHAVELHEALAAEFQVEIPDGDFWTQCLLQPLPMLYGARSAAAGGNAMGLERQEANGLLFVAVAMVRTASQQEWAYPKIKSLVEAVKAFAAATVKGGNLDWVELYKAGPSGGQVRSRAGFSEALPGGFKIDAA
ncbi:hypothetical protein PG984_003188 [Apiospora sp. TS-2023a]